MADTLATVRRLVGRRHKISRQEMVDMLLAERHAGCRREGPCALPALWRVLAVEP